MNTKSLWISWGKNITIQINRQGYARKSRYLFCVINALYWHNDCDIVKLSPSNKLMELGSSMNNFFRWYLLFDVYFSREKKNSTRNCDTLNDFDVMYSLVIIIFQVILIYNIVPHRKSSTQNMLINKLTSKIYDKCIHWIFWAWMCCCVSRAVCIILLFRCHPSCRLRHSINSKIVPPHHSVDRFVVLCTFSHVSTISTKNYIIFYSLYPII